MFVFKGVNLYVYFGEHGQNVQFLINPSKPNAPARIDLGGWKTAAP